MTGNTTITNNAAVPLASSYVTNATTGVAPTTANATAAAIAAGVYPAGVTVPVISIAPASANQVPNLALGTNSIIAAAVLGGMATTITTNAGGVQVGQTSALAYNGSVLTPGLEPSGDVNITDTADVSASVVAATIAKTGVSPFVYTAFGTSHNLNAETPVFVYGGANVTVTNSGSAVTVGDYNAATNTNVVAPTAAVTITDTASVTHDGVINADDHVVSVFGGTNVTITTNAGDVQVGTAAGVAGTEPTGNITITSTGYDQNHLGVQAYGGVNVTVSAANAPVVIGAKAPGANPSGNVTVTETGLFTGTTALDGSAVTINGGVNATVTTTGGNVAAGVAATPMTGVVSVTDTQVGVSKDAITVVGGNAATGNSVSITTTPTSGAIQVGGPTAAVLTTAGTALKTAGDYANGTVSVVNEALAGSNSAGAANVFGTGAITVNTNGATAVSIAGGGSAAVTDEQTTPATGGANAGSPIGTSTLVTVSLDGIGGVGAVGGGAATITSYALTGLTILDSAKGSAIASSTNVTVNNTAPSTVTQPALTLTLGNDGAGTFVTDTRRTGLTVTSSGTRGQHLRPVRGGGDVADVHQLVRGHFVGGGSRRTTRRSRRSRSAGPARSRCRTSPASTVRPPPTAPWPHHGTGSSGAITVGGINLFTTAFTGGSGSRHRHHHGQPGNPPPAVTVQKIAGGSGTNTIIANYAAADGRRRRCTPSNQISGFSVLGLGTLANSGVGPFNGTFTVNPYDAGGFGSLTVGQTASSVTFSDVGGGTDEPDDHGTARRQQHPWWQRSTTC